MVKNQEQKRIYLACPYNGSDATSHVHSEFYTLLSQMAVALTKEGHSVFSPIFQANAFHQYKTPYNYDTWEEIAQNILKNWATDFYMPFFGEYEFYESNETNAQFNYASSLKIPITFFSSDNITHIITDAHLSVIDPNLPMPLESNPHHADTPMCRKSYKEGRLNTLGAVVAYIQEYEGTIVAEDLFRVLDITETEMKTIESNIEDYAPMIISVVSEELDMH